MSFPRSMTAFGRGEASLAGRAWVVEIRSVNHRYSDYKIKLPRKYAALEERIKQEVAARQSRGHIEIMVTPAGGEEGGRHLAPNLELAREYYRCLMTLRDELELPDQPTLAMLRELPELIQAAEEDEDLEASWPGLQSALLAALEKAAVMREQEGEATKRELLTRLTGVETVLAAIEAAVPVTIAKRREKLQERLTALLNGADIEPTRFNQEIALLIDKGDVTEEIVRLRSHLEQFRRFLDAPEPTGRRLDFLLQEFFREINTIASKISEVVITHQTVELKNEVEKMREQVQNLE